MEQIDNNLPAIYVEREDKEAPVAGATQNSIMAYSAEMSIIEKHNAKLSNIKSKAIDAIFNHIDTTIALRLQTQRISDPRDVMKYLTTHYGNSTRASVDYEVAFWQLMQLKMNEEETFEEFYITRFNRLKTLSGISDNIALALLKAQKSRNPIGFQFVHERLNEELELCVRETSTLDAFVERLRDLDQRQLVSKNEHASRKRKANAVYTSSNKKVDNNFCRNCYNSGHKTEDCRLRACSYCREFQNEHQFHNCSARRKRNNNSRNYKRSRKNDHSSDDESENDDYSSDRSTSSNKSKSSKKGNNNNRSKSPGRSNDNSSNSKKNSNNTSNNKDKRSPTPRRNRSSDHKDNNDIEIDHSSNNETEISDSLSDSSDDSDDNSENRASYSLKQKIVRFRENLVDETDNVVEGTLVSSIYAKAAKCFIFLSC